MGRIGRITIDFFFPVSLSIYRECNAPRFFPNQFNQFNPFRWRVFTECDFYLHWVSLSSTPGLCSPLGSTHALIMVSAMKFMLLRFRCAESYSIRNTCFGRIKETRRLFLSIFFFIGFLSIVVRGQWREQSSNLSIAIILESNQAAGYEPAVQPCNPGIFSMPSYLPPCPVVHLDYN